MRNERLEQFGDPQAPSLYPSSCSARSRKRGGGHARRGGARRDRLMSLSRAIRHGQMSEGINSELIPKIRSLCHILVQCGRHWQALRCLPGMNNTSRFALVTSPLTVLPGTIALAFQPGGRTHRKAFCRFPCGIPLPIVIAQHMPHLHHATLPSVSPQSAPCLFSNVNRGHCLSRVHLDRPGRLSHGSSGKKEASFVCTLTKGRVKNFCRPSVDVLFRSVANFLAAKSLV